MKFKRDLDEWRGGGAGGTWPRRMQTTLIGELSEGQQCRLIYAMICMQKPNMLLLDEPTNHLDLECIDTLADAIKAYNGASRSYISCRTTSGSSTRWPEQIWVCEDKGVKLWNKDIPPAYRNTSRKRLSREARRRRSNQKTRSPPGFDHGRKRFCADASRFASAPSLFIPTLT